MVKRLHINIDRLRVPGNDFMGKPAETVQHAASEKKTSARRIDVTDCLFRIAVSATRKQA